MALNINADITDDPTLSKRTIKQCMGSTTCNNKEVVTFYHVTHEKFDLVYVCTGCKKYWRMREETDHDMGMDSSDDENFIRYEVDAQDKGKFKKISKQEVRAKIILTQYIVLKGEE